MAFTCLFAVKTVCEVWLNGFKNICNCAACRYKQPELMSHWWKTYKTQTTAELSFKLCGHDVLLRHQKRRSAALQATGSSPGKHIQMLHNNWTLNASEHSHFLSSFSQWSPRKQRCSGMPGFVFFYENETRNFTQCEQLTHKTASWHLKFISVYLLCNLWAGFLSQNSHILDFGASQQHMKATWLHTFNVSIP